MNDRDIQVKYSSSKLGWVKEDFLPYDTSIIFDGDARFGQIFESIQQKECRAVVQACFGAAENRSDGD